MPQGLQLKPALAASFLGLAVSVVVLAKASEALRFGRPLRTEVVLTRRSAVTSGVIALGLP